LTVYVDYIAIARNDIAKAQKLKDFLAIEFELKTWKTQAFLGC